jgi:hypothetical protein
LIGHPISAGSTWRAIRYRMKSQQRGMHTTMRASSLVAAVILVPALPALSIRAAETVVQVKLEDASVNACLSG